jgi:hypothetical protein
MRSGQSLHGLVRCSVAWRSTSETRSCFCSATGRTRPRIMGFGLQPLRNITRVCSASSQICGPFDCWERKSRVGKFFQSMPRISKKARSVLANSSSGAIPVLGRCRRVSSAPLQGAKIPSADNSLFSDISNQEPRGAGPPRAGRMQQPIEEETAPSSTTKHIDKARGESLPSRPTNSD